MTACSSLANAAAHGARSLAFAAVCACTPDPLHLGDLPECDAAIAPGACFEAAFELFEVGLDPLQVLAGDFTGDAHLEMIAVGLRGGSVGAELFRGSAGGPTTPAVDPMVTGCSAYPVAGPLTGTPRDDLMFSTCSPRVEVYAGGETGFAAAVPIELTLAPRSSVIADLDGDGDADLVTLGEASDGGVGLSVLLSDAAGTPAAPTLQPVTGLAFDPAGIRVADFDGNGVADLAIFSPGGVGALGVAHATEPPAFATPVQLPTELRIHAVAPGDFDGDGDDDLAFVDADARRLCVWVVDAAADPAPFCWSHVDLAPATLAVADVDGDGDDEAVVGDGSAPRVFLWDVDLTAASPALHELAVPADVDLVELVDLQLDGVPDLVVGHFADRSISVRFGVPERGS